MPRSTHFLNGLATQISKYELVTTKIAKVQEFRGVSQSCHILPILGKGTRHCHDPPGRPAHLVGGPGAVRQVGQEACEEQQDGGEKVKASSDHSKNTGLAICEPQMKSDPELKSRGGMLVMAFFPPGKPLTEQINRHVQLPGHLNMQVHCPKTSNLSLTLAPWPLKKTPHFGV